MVQTKTVPLSHEHIDGWVNLYNRFHRPFSWILSMDMNDALALLEEGPASCSYVVLREQEVVTIATLDMRGESKTANIRNLASRHGHQDAARSLLEHMRAVAKERGFDCIDAWVYDSIRPAIRLLKGSEFKEKDRDSLMLMRPDEDLTRLDASSLVFRSLDDGLSIGSFVEANRAAFEGEDSRLLETSELEKWVADSDGYLPEMQLAALKGNTIVGSVMSEVAEVRRGKSLVKMAWVYGLGVVPTVRRQGVGTALMNELLKRLRSHGVSEVWLVTDAEGEIRAFYEQVGFRVHAYVLQFSSPLR